MVAEGAAVLQVDRVKLKHIGAHGCCYFEGFGSDGVDRVAHAHAQVGEGPHHREVDIGDRVHHRALKHNEQCALLISRKKFPGCRAHCQEIDAAGRIDSLDTATAPTALAHRGYKQLAGWFLGTA